MINAVNTTHDALNPKPMRVSLVITPVHPQWTEAANTLISQARKTS
jgi:hypothetical protein